MNRTFETNLRCESCVAAIAPVLNSEPAIASWQADVKSTGKPLTVEGKHVTKELVDTLLRRAGYQVLREVAKPETTAVSTPEDAGPRTSYFPLALVALYIAGTAGLIELSFGAFDANRAMANFMAGFFLVFSFFKLLDVPSFADAFGSYDILAKRSRAYAVAYPFVELGLGVAYLTRFQPTLTNAVTLAIMGVGTLGVLQSLLHRRKIRCACLGTVFNLPMSSVTLIEDVSMALMAAFMLLWSHGG